MKIWLKALIFALVIALLSTAYYFVLKYEPDKDDEQPLGGISLFSAQIDEVERLEIKNPSGRYAFIKKDDAFVVEGREYIELDQVKVETLISSMAELSALEEIGQNEANLAAYGLEKPQATIYIQLKNGAEGTFCLGDMAPDNSSYYLKGVADNRVYLVYNTRGTYMLNPLTAYRPLQITSFDPKDVKYMKIENEGKVFEVEYAPYDEVRDSDTGALWQILKPFKKKADNDYVSELVFNPASSLVAEDIVIDNPASLSEFGLDKINVTVKTSNETINFKIGEKDNNAFVFMEGRTPVYKISSGAVAFADVDAFEVAEKFAAIYNLKRVAGISITSASQNVDIVIKHNEDETKTEYYVGGISVGESSFKTLYQKIIGLTVDGVATKSLDKTVLCTILYKMTDGSVKRVEIYPYDEFNVAVNDGVNDIFFMKTKKLNEMYEELSRFKKNP